MRMTGLLRLLIATLVAGGLSTMESLSAQVLRARSSYVGRTFHGAQNMRGFLAFDSCTFVTDSVVLDFANGALFSNCRFESSSGKLYIADSGTGIILADCNVYGADTILITRRIHEQDRNYVSHVMTEGTEYVFPPEDCNTVINMEGTQLECLARGVEQGPVFVNILQDRINLHANETATLNIEGLEPGMFLGWQLEDSSARLDVSRSYGEFECRVTAPRTIEQPRNIYVTAFTEYGLETVACLRLVPDYREEPAQEKRRRCFLFRRNRKRK